VTREDSNGCGKDTYEREQNRARHPAWHLRMTKEFIRHHDKGWEEDEAKTSELGRYTQTQYKCEQSDNPEAIVGIGFWSINRPRIIRCLMGRLIDRVFGKGGISKMRLGRVLES
jgi:hypothetical protein